MVTRKLELHVVILLAVQSSLPGVPGESHLLPPHWVTGK